MLNIPNDGILFGLCLTTKKEVQEEEQVKRNKQVPIFVWFFLRLLKFSLTKTVNLALEKQREVGCKLFDPLSFIFLKGTQVPYV